MEAFVRLRIEGASRDAALAAARWLPGFYPQVAVTLEGDTVALRSETHDAAGLTALWSAAIANELLLARGAAQRAAAFKALAR